MSKRIWTWIAGLVFASGASASGVQSLRTLDEASAYLEQQNLGEVRHYSTRDFGRDQYSGARSVVVKPELAETLLRDLRGRLGPGLVAFIGTTNSLAAPSSVGAEIVIGKGTSQFDVLRIAASDAVNHGMGTEDLIKKLRTWDAAYGIDIFQAETDTIQFRLKKPPRDMRAFAKDLYAFCPDIVDQGTLTVDALQKEIERTHTVFLWWD